jgi:CheY-like chemotaxis protein
MTNILVVDTREECGSLVKGVLMGHTYGVSLSDSYDEAQQKLETGLFDLICLNEDNNSPGFIKEAVHLIPDLPIITIGEDEKPVSEATKIFKVLTRPVNLIRLTAAVREAVRFLNNQMHKTAHQGVLLPVEVGVNKTVLKCLMTEVGLKGALMQSDPATDSTGKQFSEFFRPYTGSRQRDNPPAELTTAILVKNAEPLRLKPRVAFIERRVDEFINRVGLSFATLKSEEQTLLEKLIAQAA